jgi:uncharacterized protein (TIGR02996 family)
VNHQNAFLKALAENEDDTTTRLVYADWLEEQGLHEEADRQRKWPAAKEWLVRLLRDHPPEKDSYDDLNEPVISYRTLLKLGQQAIDEVDDVRGFVISCGNHITMSFALNDSCKDFWKNWSIVTGVPLPLDVEKRSSFTCCY